MRCAGTSWLVHALGLGQNPVRRRVDRLVAVALLLVLVAGVIGAPVLAVSWGQAEYAAQQREAAVLASSQRVVDAVVLTDPDEVGSEAGGDVSSRADVRWTSHSGLPRVERAEVPPGSDVGEHVPLWVDAADHAAPAPPSDTTIRASAVGTSIGVLALGLLACAGLMKAVRVAGDAWAQRRWAREWERVEQEWSDPGRG
ncbi:hypothetical protein EIL87_11700 [Saccharopolyspora rhizosphaerae]|uniref:Transmembrane protein n=1 Tax=Saccharopolyspora rhizosphaerae TaxID=2492662 RepID=A0A3R8Q279_9PSEU|nr:hypothetical protein [Saccharopolyspora rhizosphaerae]RRO16941.1 hypothetical protein EIL87_11700 [Saccharopolyspora rhizosphaerae]